MIVFSIFTPNDRADAFPHLWRMLELASHSNEAMRREAQIWIDARCEEEPGFLWLVGRLGMRPSVLEDALRAIANGNDRRRKTIQRRLQQTLVDSLHAKILEA